MVHGSVYLAPERGQGVQNSRSAERGGEAALGMILSCTAAGPVYITCAARKFHTRLMNHAEHLFWVIYFPLSITSPARHSLNLNQITIAFSTHHPLKFSSIPLLVTDGASILPGRETKKHPRLENNLSNYLSSLS